MEGTPRVLLLVVLMVTSQASSTSKYACDTSNSSLGYLPFCDVRLGTGERVRDLVSRLTVDEKVGQMVNAARGIQRLGIPEYQWWQEALHGVATSPGVQFGGDASGATSFPVPITTAASFNTALFYKIGQAVSTEARAMYNLGRSGLTFWSPNVNIFRDPRWGRGQETPGEDPLLASKFAEFYVKGLQDELPNGYLKLSACCKHLTAYDVDNWKGTDRYHFNAEVSEQDLEDTYNRPFESCIREGGVSSIMCSYNRVNGVPTCADRKLLTETVRENWGLNGYIVSDCDSLKVFYDSTTYAPSPEDAVADSILAGLDLNCGTFLADHALAALRAGKIAESDLDRAVSNLMTTRMRLGLFDGHDPWYGKLGLNDICSKDHDKLALDAALEGIVLLKNDGSLPLPSARLKSVAIIGPNANATHTMLGNYEGVPCKYVSPLQGLTMYSRNVTYASGCRNVACSGSELFGEAVRVATKSDAVVIVAGLDQSVEAETLDRTSLLLPGMQPQLITRIADSVSCPIILVVMSAGPVDVSQFKNDPRISSILWLGYPGQSGGAALAHVLFGAYNPGGRLPMTWYPEEFIKDVNMLDMSMRPDVRTAYPGRSYRFYTGPRLFSFGDGLSYTTYSYRFISAPLELSVSDSDEGACQASNCNIHLHVLSATDICKRLRFEARVAVSSSGGMSGGHPVLLYTVPPWVPAEGAPQKQLIAFKRVHLEAGFAQEVVFDVDPCRDLSIVHRDGERFLHLGQHELLLPDGVIHGLVITS